jgi:hypothetical protein
MRFPRFPIVLALAGILVVSCDTGNDPSRPGRAILVLRNTTTGQSAYLDSDGYQVTGLPGSPFAIAANDSVTIQLNPGDYSLALTGIAGNCAADTLQFTLRVRARRRTEARWDISCLPIPGHASVVFDPGTPIAIGAVSFTLDAGLALQLVPGDTVDLGSLLPGPHVLALGASAANCRVAGGLSQQFTVAAAESTVVTLTGYCSAGTLACDENVATSDSTNGWSLYRMSADNSGLQRFSGPAIDGGNFPAISPDGSEIAYVTSYDSLMVMNSNGTNPRLVSHILNVKSPVWSPSGSQIAVSASLGGTSYDIYVIDADGNNFISVVSDSARDEDPSWSPDGNSILFSSDRSGSNEIYRIALNGVTLDTLTGPGRLVSPPGSYGSYHPMWSPDQSQIALLSGDSYQLWIMNADGTNPHIVAAYGNYISQVAWSPDGRFLAFYVTGAGIVYQPVDGLYATTIPRVGSPTSYRVSWGP